eukprot:Pgem_evm1s11907
MLFKIALIGMASGSLVLGPYVTAHIGRKKSIALGALISLLASCATAFLSFGIVAVFFIERFLFGIGVGIACFTLPMYNAEIAP